MAYTTIDDPSAHFQTALWSGNDSTQSITNDGNSDLQPDWLWGKIRDDNADQLRNNWWIDSTRGINKALGSNTTSVEEWNGTNWSNVDTLNTAAAGIGGAGTTTAGLAYGGFSTTTLGSTEEWSGTGLITKTLTTTED